MLKPQGQHVRSYPVRALAESHRASHANDHTCMWCDVRCCLEVALGVLLVTLYVIGIIYV